MPSTIELKLNQPVFSLIDKMADFFSLLKVDFDSYDLKEKLEFKRIEYLLLRKKEVFPIFDNYFGKLWILIKDLDQKLYRQAKNYYEQKMFCFLGKDIEINTHIRLKPFGYGGDFVTMNYIYDYHKDKYLGKSTYQKFINHYTCNIEVARSNIRRKDYIKNLILDYLSKDKFSPKRILSIGCGSAREVEELIRENKIKSPVNFLLVDFESEALFYVKERLNALKFDKDLIKVSFIKTDLIGLLKDKDLRNKFSSIDFVYISGVFDYLSDRLCKRITRDIVSVLNKNSIFLIANMSFERASHRAYYEIFGEWVMFHRKKEDMVSWVQLLKDGFSYKLLEIDGCKGYHFLQIKSV